MSNPNHPAYPYAVPPGGMYNMGLTKLEAFTMAAMQGLAVTFGKEIATQEYAPLLAKDAVEIARATLAELSKHQ